MNIELIPVTTLQRARFARLPKNLSEAHKAISEETAPEQDYLCIEHAQLTNKEYDEFGKDFRTPIEWLNETGGWSSGGSEAETESEEWWKSAYHMCIKVTSPGKPTLLIDAQGQDRPVYVGIEESALVDAN